MAKKKFEYGFLNEYGPIIKVKLKSTKRNANIDYYNNIKEKHIIVSALIDTGATHSIIDLSILKEDIGLEETKFTDRQLFVHGLKETLPVYKIGLDLLQNNNCIDVHVAAMDLSIFKIPEVSLKMLIGRDILRECIFTYNGLDNIFTLNHKVNN